jgi:hypothetical protein
VLKAAAAARLAAGQAELDLGLAAETGFGAVADHHVADDHLWDALCAAYQAVGFESVAQGDNVLRDLVLARIIEATSKADAGRVLAEVGVEAASYTTLKRRPTSGMRLPPATPRARPATRRAS